MKSLNITLGVCLLGITVSAGATVGKWLNEPESFFGVKLGSRMPIPTKCAKKHTNNLCYWESKEDHFVEYEMKGPDIGIDYTLTVRQFEGQVSQITMTPTRAYERDGVIKILNEKFGPPTEVLRNQGNSRGTLTNWNGGNVSMYTFGADRVFYVTVIENRLYHQANEIEGQNRDKAEANKIKKAAAQF